MVSIRGWGEREELGGERHARAERNSAGQGYSKGSRLQAIVPAAPFVSNLPFLGRHPLPLPVRLVLLCVFNSQLCNQFIAPSPIVSFSFSFSDCLCPSVFFLCFTENFIPLSPFPVFIPVTLDPAAISCRLLSTLAFPHDVTHQFFTCSFFPIFGFDACFLCHV